MGNGREVGERVGVGDKGLAASVSMGVGVSVWVDVIDGKSGVPGLFVPSLRFSGVMNKAPVSAVNSDKMAISTGSK